MQTIKFYKDGSNRIELNKQLYRPLTLEKVLFLNSAFYAGTAINEDGNPVDDIENPISEWFNFKGFTYVPANKVPKDFDAIFKRQNGDVITH